MRKELLRTMDRLGMILDVNHLCDEALWDALDLYKGPIWVRGESTPRGMNCGMEIMANNIDHVCQLAGNANHVAIGSDLDGAFAGISYCNPGCSDTAMRMQ